MLFLDCDPDLRPGDLAEVSGIAGLSLILSQPQDEAGPMTLSLSSEDRMLPVIVVYMGHVLHDYGIDKENVPLVIHEGRRMIVSRGQVRRV